MTRVSTVENQSITTIEGLVDTEIHPVQQAWEEPPPTLCGTGKPETPSLLSLLLVIDQSSGHFLSHRSL
jgi:aerobic-type carbon monoxide dehydrogenase small subunit (CoxS/CutS family)